jgi:hypothetical protein
VLNPREIAIIRGFYGIGTEPVTVQELATQWKTSLKTINVHKREALSKMWVFIEQGAQKVSWDGWGAHRCTPTYTKNTIARRRIFEGHKTKDLSKEYGINIESIREYVRKYKKEHGIS